MVTRVSTSSRLARRYTLPYLSLMHRMIDPEIARHRGRVAALVRAGRDDEADDARGELAARRLLLAARQASPRLTATQIDEIVEALRGSPAA